MIIHKLFDSFAIIDQVHNSVWTLLYHQWRAVLGSYFEETTAGHRAI